MARERRAFTSRYTARSVPVSDRFETEGEPLGPRKSHTSTTTKSERDGAKQRTEEAMVPPVEAPRPSITVSSTPSVDAKSPGVTTGTYDQPRPIEQCFTDAAEHSPLELESKIEIVSRNRPPSSTNDGARSMRR
ncbi:hypothetical protein QLX08_003574 [Tetragonisca angustula]|uniref:Uncharacterized protein n=1 Tax=Tetragonisca angustula TaxID=166442 RepID=A0AAW1A8J6_9HYME